MLRGARLKNRTSARLRYERSSLVYATLSDAKDGSNSRGRCMVSIYQSDEHTIVYRCGLSFRGYTW